MISLEYPFCHVQRNMFARKSSFFSEFLHCLFLYLQDNQYYIIIFHSDCLLVSDCHKVPVCIFVASFCALTKFRRFFSYFDSWGQSSNSRRLKMINAKQTGRQLTQSLSCFVFSITVRLKKNRDSAMCIPKLILTDLTQKVAWLLHFVVIINYQLTLHLYNQLRGYDIALATLQSVDDPRPKLFRSQYSGACSDVLILFLLPFKRLPRKLPKEYQPLW